MSSVDRKAAFLRRDQLKSAKGNDLHRVKILNKLNILLCLCLVNVTAITICLSLSMSIIMYVMLLVVI